MSKNNNGTARQATRDNIMLSRKVALCMSDKQDRDTKTLVMFSSYCCISVGRDSSVGTATRYGLDGPGIESH
jgi:hypothetical protein